MNLSSVASAFLVGAIALALGGAGIGVVTALVTVGVVWELVVFFLAGVAPE